MSDLTAAAANMCVAVSCQNVPGTKPTASGTAEGPALSFQDVPALAKIRKQIESYNNRAEGKRNGDSVSNGVSGSIDKTSSPGSSEKRVEGDGRGRCCADGQACSSKGKTRSAGHRIKGDAVVAPAAGGIPQVDPAGSGSSHCGGNARSSGDVHPRGRIGPASPQHPDHPQISCGTGFLHRLSRLVNAAAALSGGKSAADISKKTVAQAGTASGGAQREGASATGKALEVGQDTTTAKPKGTVQEGRTHHEGHLTDKAGRNRAAGLAGPVETKAPAKVQAPDVERQSYRNAGKVGLEQASAMQVADKADRNQSPHRAKGRQVFSQETSGPKSGGDAQAVTTQTQGRDGYFSGSKEGSRDQVEVSVSAGNGPTTFAQRLSAQDSRTSGSGAAAFKSTSQSVGDQILDSVRATLAGGERQVLVRLNPPELGSVTVRFQEQGEQIRAVLEVSRNETRQEVERAIPEVLRTLQDAGVQIRRVEVVLSDQSGRDLAKEQLQQDAWAQQHTAQQHAGNSQTPPTAGWEPRGEVAQSGLEHDAVGLQTPSAADRIDMLM